MESGDTPRLFVDDVTWTTTDAAAVARGPLAVREHISALHPLMLGTHTQELATADLTAYLESDCLGYLSQRANRRLVAGSWKRAARPRVRPRS
jgi:hypothetical protein